MPIGQPQSPPRKTTATTKKPAPVTSTDRVTGRAEEINSLFQAGSAVSVLMGNYADAGACELHGPAISRELALMAETNENLAAFFDKSSTISPYMGLAMALMPFLMQIAANHGRVDASKANGFAGVMPPEMLSAKIQAAMDTKKAEMLREAAEAKEEAEKAHARLASVERAA